MKSRKKTSLANFVNFVLLLILLLSRVVVCSRGDLASLATPACLPRDEEAASFDTKHDASCCFRQPPFVDVGGDAIDGSISRPSSEFFEFSIDVRHPVIFLQLLTCSVPISKLWVVAEFGRRPEGIVSAASFFFSFFFFFFFFFSSPFSTPSFSLPRSSLREQSTAADPPPLRVR